jgi:hypothetical protein
MHRIQGKRVRRSSPVINFPEAYSLDVGAVLVTKLSAFFAMNLNRSWFFPTIPFLINKEDRDGIDAPGAQVQLSVPVLAIGLFRTYERSPGNQIFRVLLCTPVQLPVLLVPVQAPLFTKFAMAFVLDQGVGASQGAAIGSGLVTNGLQSRLRSFIP